MDYDVIVIGAGIGGLFAAAKLARAGRKVLVLEKNPHIGGTSYFFRRGGYSFPMGPLSFSYPGRVEAFLDEIGIDAEIEFRRNHFQLLTPDLDIVYSQPLAALEEELRRKFPDESEGLGRVFAELGQAVNAVTPGDDAASVPGSNTERVRAWATTSSRDFLSSRLSDGRLRNLIGSQGTDPPDMSMLNLAIMWKAMSDVGIWFPAMGIHGLCRMMAAAVGFSGGTIRIGVPVAKIVTGGGRAVGVRTADGNLVTADHIVSNADYKKTFLELVAAEDVPADHLEAVRSTPYTGSELCVYCGVRPSRVDFRKMRATHLFYRKEIRPDNEDGAEDFDNREVEICRFSDNAPETVPFGRASLLLRAHFPYRLVAEWRTGEKKRKPGYREEKNRLGWKLIRTVETVLPGLSAAIETLEAATPLTYQDWGQRTLGSIAGWSWSPEAAVRFPERLLVRTPLAGLYAVGVYAARELFLGGVPTALFTGGLAADVILNSRTRP